MDTAFPHYAWTGSEQTIAEVLFGLAMLASLAYCVAVARRRGAVWPLAVFGGALLTVLYEPLNNVLAHCAWPEAGQHTLFSMLGRDMPFVAVGVYTVYFAADDARSWAFVPAVPLSLFAVHTSASLPVFFAVGGSAGLTWITVATFISIAISLAYMALVVAVVGERRGTDRPSRASSAEAPARRIAEPVGS